MSLEPKGKDSKALDQRLHDDFLKMDEEEAKDPFEPATDTSKMKKLQKEVLISETNQDGLMTGHNPI